MKKIKIIYEFEPYAPNPENYDGETDIKKMAKRDVDQIVRHDIVNWVEYFEGKITVRYEIVDE